MSGAPKFLQRKQQRGGGSNNTSPKGRMLEERKTQQSSPSTDFMSKQYQAFYGSKNSNKNSNLSPRTSPSGVTTSTAIVSQQYNNNNNNNNNNIASPTSSSATLATKALQKANMLSRDEIEKALEEIEEERNSTQNQLEQVRLSLQDRNDAAQQLLQDTYAMDTASKLKTLPPQLQNIAKSALEEAKAEVQSEWSEEELRLLDWLEELVNERSQLKQESLQKKVQHAKDIRDALKIPSQGQTDKFRQLTDKLLESESQRADIVIELGQAQRTAQDLRILLSSKGADEVRHAREVVARMERDLEASQGERKTQANKIVELQSRNAVLMAEKSRWLEQVQEENGQLQTLFKEARSAKEMMVRELNLIDRERRELEEERHQLRSKLQQYNQNLRSGLGGSQRGGGGNYRGGAVDVRTLRSAGRLNETTKKLRDELLLRQEAMRNVFEAGKGILESVFRRNMQLDPNNRNAIVTTTYIPSQNFENFDKLYTQLVSFSLDADNSLLLEASRNNIEFKGEFAAVNTKIESIAIAFEDRLKAQRSYLADNESRMEKKWADMWSNVSFINDNDIDIEMKKILGDLNKIVPRALAAGGSAQTAGDEAVRLNLDNMNNNNNNNGGFSNRGNSRSNMSENIMLKQQVEKLTGELDRLQSLHRALHSNHNKLKAKARQQK